MQQTLTPWWERDTYAMDAAVAPQLLRVSHGPRGFALVRAWPDGRTDKGWGLTPPPGSTEGFMPRYMRGEFSSRRVIKGFELGRWNFAYVMRALPLVVIDIDGKNGGLEHAKRLGALPPTLAETSKSGNGYHLFYSTDEEWDDELGFARFSDRIGIEQGVDIRATGCVYHHRQQRWNSRLIAPLPEHLGELLTRRSQQTAAATARVMSALASQDETEILMLHADILEALAKPIPAGRRNNTLFAIGSQMIASGIEDWEQKLSDRAAQVGLDSGEIDKLLRNVARYGAKNVATV